MTDSTDTQRLELVREHVRRENAHDLEGVMATFGEHGWYDDEPWGEHHEGRDAVRGYYAHLMQALPDLHIDIRHEYVSEENVILEVVISGTHEGTWRGMPPTGRPVRFPLCAVYDFDERGEIAGERIYYDRAEVLNQLGILFEPTSLPGRLAAVLLHPLTFARALTYRIRSLMSD